MPDQFEYIPGGTAFERLPDEGTMINRWRAVTMPRDEEEQRYENYRSKLGDMPVDQALKAINAAEQFLAMRMAQKDIAQGVAPAEAVMKRFAPVWGQQPRYAGTAMRGAYDALPPSVQRVGPDNTPVLQGRNVKLMPQEQDISFLPGPEGTQFWKQGNRGGQVRLPTGMDKDVQPKIMKFADGTEAYYNPSTGAFRLKRDDQEAELSLKGMQDLAGSGNVSEQMSKDIYTFLGNVVSNQIAKATAPKPAAKPAADTGAPQAPQSPFTEGQRIRNKKDGKIYVVRNGVPVLEGK